MSQTGPIRMPQGFVFGASTASTQIDGDADGRGVSIWDTFAAEAGRIADGSSPAVACDHINRMDADVDLMADLGLTGYRFSIAWPRIQPSGTGPANAAGLDFYDRLVDRLLAAGIAPMATLYHWDLPQPLQDAGGWLNRDTAAAFGDYTQIVAARLADRVSYWCPVNEPNIHMLLGYALGVHAPGQTLGFGALTAGHQLMLGHGHAVAALRAAGAAAVGTATNHTPVLAASEEEPDVQAAGLYDAIHNGAFAGPVLAGAYPEPIAGMIEVLDGDLELISAPLDFYGVNYYNPTLVGRPGAAQTVPEFSGEAMAAVPLSILDLPGYPRTDLGWPVVPQGLTDMLVQLKQRYPNLPPVHITENGCAHAPLQDQFRIDYLASHLGAVNDAIAAGVDVAGYWTWSLLDNWEWAHGFGPRFGLVHVDYDTQVRTPRASAGWYRDVIAAQQR